MSKALALNSVSTPTAIWFDRRRTKILCLAALCGLLLIAIGLWLRPRDLNADVLRIAYEFKDGGGYSRRTESGVAGGVNFKGVSILGPSSSGGTFNCGYTFLVAMRVAEEKGLLANLEPYQVKRFQKEWYGSTGGSSVKEFVTAMETLEIGIEIDRLHARPGDFVKFRTRSYGCSAIFLGWLTSKDGKIIGLRYRASLPAGNGIRDWESYFTSSGFASAAVLPETVFVGRLRS